MGAIAYVTDSKMLELHRLNAHKTMNFWRLTAKTAFTDFEKGDLVFFLSKDKAHMSSRREKGIVGYGRLESVHVASLQTMWKNYGIYNGYNSLEEFKGALLKVNKGKEVPRKISSLYLTDVSFFQVPIYLSECGMKISNSVESYVYLKPEEVTIRILEKAKGLQDLWSTDEDTASIEKDELRCALFLTQRRCGDLPLSDKALRKAARTLKAVEGYELIPHAKTAAYKIDEEGISILFYHDKDIDPRLLLGQIQCYRYYMNQIIQKEIPMRFQISDRDPELGSMIEYTDPKEV